MANTIKKIKVKGVEYDLKAKYDENGNEITDKYLDKDTSQDVSGVKTFTANIKTNEVDNTNGNAMVRFKETENKVVLGGSTIPTTIMGSGDRPTYSKDGSDFSGSELALLDDTGAYSINSFTTENDFLSSLEIKSKNDSVVNTKLLSMNYVTFVPSDLSDNAPKVRKAYMKLGDGSLTIDSINGSNCIIKRYPSTLDKYIELRFEMDQILIEQFGNTGAFNTEYLYFPKMMRNSTSSKFYTDIYILSDSNYDEYIKTYQHTLTISNGNEFEGLIIKFTEKPTSTSTPTSITTSELFISNINYIKDVVGYRISNGSVIPCVFTYENDVLKLNGTEIDASSLTITDNVVAL